jgi:hypothetical protein
MVAQRGREEANAGGSVVGVVFPAGPSLRCPHSPRSLFPMAAATLLCKHGQSLDEEYLKEFEKSFPYISLLKDVLYFGTVEGYTLDQGFKKKEQAPLLLSGHKTPLYLRCLILWGGVYLDSESSSAPRASISEQSCTQGVLHHVIVSASRRSITARAWRCDHRVPAEGSFEKKKDFEV